MNKARDMTIYDEELESLKSACGEDYLRHASIMKQRGFFGAIKQRHDNMLDACIIAKIFETMDLPEPDSKEFMDGTGCQVVFLNRFGLVLKAMEPFQAKSFEMTQQCKSGRDLVLQPLRYQRMNSGGALMIVPGIEMPADDDPVDHWEYLIEQSSHTPFIFRDTQPVNMGVLPTPWKVNGVKTKFPVVLDHGCINAREEQGMNLRKAFHRASYQGIQDRIYGDLRSRLEEAWPKGQLPIRSKMTEFFNECASIVSKPKDDPKRILSASWTELKDNYDKNKVASATHYEAHIMRDRLRTLF
jgi:hypothetical protein